MTTPLCKWCGAPTKADALPSDATANVCAGRYACSQRKAMEEGQEDRAARAALAAHDAADCSKLIEAVGALAHAIGIAWSDADVPTALEVLAEAPKRFAALEAEVAALEAWVKGDGSLGSGRVAKAVLKYAHDHEERVWTMAEEKQRKVLEVIVDFALAGRSKLDGRSMEHALIQIQHAAQGAMAKPPLGETHGRS